MMRKRIVTNILKKVHDSYSSIADDFDRTRRLPWKEFSFFLPYLKKGMRVLDLGSGNGRLYEYLQKRDIDYTGIDHSEALIRIALKRYPEAHFEVTDFTNLRSQDPRKYDLIFSIASFHHLPSVSLRKEVLNQIHQRLFKDGLLIMTVWNLRQRQYWREWLSSVFFFALHLGLKYSWNDLWIRWGKVKQKRYYHAFTLSELRRLFNCPGWSLEEFYFTRKGNRVAPSEAYNICLVARKIS